VDEQLSPLHERHEAAGADFTEFGGWTMPVTFDGIQDEHLAVRNSAGVFDVSHMSEVDVRGPDALSLMNRLTTNGVAALDPGDAQYTCILDEDGIILDDAVVYRYPEQDGYLFVPNAGHGAWMTDRWAEHAAAWDLNATVTDRTSEVGLVAVQGPDAVSLVDDVAEAKIDDIDRFTCRRTTVAGASCLVARTGYTGEDGVEIVVDAGEAMAVWDAFDGVRPCGLGARDTLRIEAGLLLSGRDFDPDTEPRTPIEAGLEFVVDFATPFVGREALEAQRESGVDQRLVGIRPSSRAIPRNGYAIHDDGDQIGHVTSGTKSPTFNVPLVLGFVDVPYAEPGTEVTIAVRDRVVDATVVSQRFLDSMD